MSAKDKKIYKRKDTINLNQAKFETFAYDWLIFKNTFIKESSYVKYKNLIEHYILPYFGNDSISDITDEKIESYCIKMVNEGGIICSGLPRKTISDILSVIRNILQYAKRSGYVVMTDAKLANIKQPVRKMRILTQTEQRKIYDYICNMPSNKNLGILICLFTGIRIGELCALKWDDISLNEKTIFIHQTMQRIQDTENGIKNKTKIIITPPKSECSVRMIPLPSGLAELISQSQTSHCGYFLTGESNHWIEPRTMQYHFKKLLQECSITDTNYHCLRHTFATRCVEAGFDVKSLSEILGHANVNITMNRYVHPSLEVKRKNMERLSALLDIR